MSDMKLLSSPVFGWITYITVQLWVDFALERALNEHLHAQWASNDHTAHALVR